MLKAYNNLVRGFLGFLTGSFPVTKVSVDSGKDKLDVAFKVFEDARVQAHDAISTLQDEQDKVQLDIKELEEEYKKKMQEKVQTNDEIMLQKARAAAFMGKIDNILGSTN